MRKKKTGLDHNAFQAEFWNGVSRRSQPEERGRVSYPALVEMEKFFEFMNLPEGSNILEVGCGRGRYTLPLLERGHIIHATEISRQSLTYLERKTSQAGLTERLTTEETNYENEDDCRQHFGKFDVALCVGSIHHFNPETRVRIFLNIVKSVKTNGWVVALEPNPLNPLWYLLLLWRGVLNVQADSRWEVDKGFLKSSPRNLKRLFQKAGLKEIAVKRYAWLPSKFANRFRFVIHFNDFLLRLPLIKHLSAFLWVKGKKS